MRDAAADIARRAWLDCPRCAGAADCATCRAGRTCDTHWRYMLGSAGRNIFLQCPECLHRWWHDTGFGVGDRPPGIGDVSGFWTDVA
ncbi:MAG: hypothetical protein GEV09_00440 [Pseudonocardiaceae bacterium]|nr:hypothetical protein [Pseudonocardiaceae bacterium]